MGKDQPHPVLFKDIRVRGNPICLGANFNVIPFILRNFAEEFVQILGKFGNRDPIVLDVVFLLEDDSMKAGAEDLNGGLVELFGENIRIQVIFVLNKGAASPQLPGDDDLRGFEEDQIPLFHLLAIAFQNMKIRGGISPDSRRGR